VRALRSFLIVSRAGIQVTSFPTASLGIFLAARTWHEMLRPPVLVYVLIFFVILTYSCQINCLNDLEVDKKYKKYMSDAVQSLGIQNLKKIMVSEIGIAVGLIILLSALKRDGLYLLALLGVWCGYAYSAPPLRIKKRGVLSPLPVLAGLYFLPIVAGWYIIRDRLSAFIILFGIGYALTMQGITFINTCEDLAEDRSSGVKTWAHILGPKNTLFLGALFVLCGGLLDIYLFFSQKASLHLTRNLFFPLIVILVLFFVLSVFYICRRLYFISRSSDPLPLCKKEARQMPAWFLMTRYPLLFMAMLSIF
jgi:4-hydroxybenzoate polyprenyltransferase